MNEEMRSRIEERDEHLHQLMEEYNQSKFKGLMSFAEYSHFVLLVEIENRLYEQSEEDKEIKQL